MNGGLSASAAHAISALPTSLPGHVPPPPPDPIHQRLAGIDAREERRQILGEELYPRVVALEPALAGKITGMLLEVEEADVLAMLDNNMACQDKVAEAKRVLISSGHINDQGAVADQMAALSVS